MIGSFCPGSDILLIALRACLVLTRMIDTLTELVKEKARPFLGICVGMQLLADTGSEGGQTIAGLGWIQARSIWLIWSA